MKRCDNGHYYDEKKHSSCPACGVNLSTGRTVPHGAHPPSPAPSMASGAVVGGTRRMASSPGPAEAAGKTVAMYSEELGGIDPVVGWLVCIHGPDRGKDYRIKAERNFIGRNSENHICIANDPTVSRSKHAIISFNPKKNKFRILPGESSGLVYLNDEEVDMPRSLHPYDTIELGNSRFRFVPLCGPHFSWRDPISKPDPDNSDLPNPGSE